MAAIITAATTMPPMIMKIFFLFTPGNFPKGQGDLSDDGGNDGGGGGSAAIVEVCFL